MKNHFYMAYAGNKRNEVEKIYSEIENDLKDITTIVEPFCGSCAISYYISQINPKKYKYVLNDNNKYLLEMYNIIKDIDKLKKFDEEVKNTLNLIENKVFYKDIIRNNNLISWFIKHKYYNIRPGLYDKDFFPLKKDYLFKSIRDYPIYNFFNEENIEFTNVDGLYVYEKYKINNTSLIILDPPYLQSCNDFYQCSSVNIYEHLFKNNIKYEKSKIFLILENIWLINLLFKDNHTICKYSKKYESSKKKTEHVIIMN